LLLLVFFFSITVFANGDDTGISLGNFDTGWFWFEKFNLEHNIAVFFTVTIFISSFFAFFSDQLISKLWKFFIDELDLNSTLSLIVWESNLLQNWAVVVKFNSRC